MMSGLSGKGVTRPGDPGELAGNHSGARAVQAPRLVPAPREVARGERVLLGNAGVLTRGITTARMAAFRTSRPARAARAAGARPVLAPCHSIRVDQDRRRWSRHRADPQSHDTAKLARLAWADPKPQSPGRPSDPDRRRRRPPRRARIGSPRTRLATIATAIAIARRSGRASTRAHGRTSRVCSPWGPFTSTSSVAPSSTWRSQVTRCDAPFAPRPPTISTLGRPAMMEMSQAARIESSRSPAPSRSYAGAPEHVRGVLPTVHDLHGDPYEAPVALGFDDADVQTREPRDELLHESIEALQRGADLPLGRIPAGAGLPAADEPRHPPPRSTGCQSTNPTPPRTSSSQRPQAVSAAREDRLRAMRWPEPTEAKLRDSQAREAGRHARGHPAPRARSRPSRFQAPA